MLARVTGQSSLAPEHFSSSYREPDYMEWGLEVGKKAVEASGPEVGELVSELGLTLLGQTGQPGLQVLACGLRIREWPLV